VIEIRDGGELWVEAFAAALRPPPRLTVSEWADRYRQLQTKNAAEPGAYRTSRVPYVREIADCLSEGSPARKVVVMKGAQLGLTEVGNNWIGYTIHHSPAPMLMVMPSDDLAERTSRQRLTPMFESTPELAERIAPVKSRTAGNTTLVKDFAGGILVLASAGSTGQLRSTPAKNLFCDELDEWPVEIGAGADPLKLAERAQRTFPFRKSFLISTPTSEGRSRIAAEFENSDRRFYHVPCPDCGEFQKLVWTGVRYEVDAGGDVVPESVAYACCSCGVLIPERRKTEMLAKGIWVPQAPERSSDVRGYHISSLYSPVGWYSWLDAAQDFEVGRKDPVKLHAFVNEVLGETWREKGDAPDWEQLYRRREPYPIGTVPAGGLVLTAGVDVQDDRLEIEVVAWGRNRESWSVDYLVYPGNTAEPEPWEQLEQLLHRKYTHVSGLELPIRAMAVDSGFRTQTVYAWVRGQPRTRVFACQGMDPLPVLVAAPSAVDVKIGGRKLRRGLKLWGIGTGLAKEELYGFLRRDPPLHPERDGWPHGWCHFPEYPEGFFRGLTAEELQVRVKRSAGATGRGRRVYVWEKIRERNEPLDCRVLARAAANVHGIDRWKAEDWDRAATSMGAAPAPPPPAPAPTPPSAQAPSTRDDPERPGRGRPPTGGFNLRRRR
jgi:phage terminase large subunit GpA-like protein